MYNLCNSFHSQATKFWRTGIPSDSLGPASFIDKPNGNPIPFDAYLDSINYKKYPVSGAGFLKTTESVVKDNSNGLFYYLLLTAWIKIFALNLFLIRVLSILITGINLWLIYIFSKMLGIRSLLCLLLLFGLAVNPVFSGDAILIRSYMMALSGCLVSIVYLYKAV